MLIPILGEVDVVSPLTGALRTICLLVYCQCSIYRTSRPYMMQGPKPQSAMPSPSNVDNNDVDVPLETSEQPARLAPSTSEGMLLFVDAPVLECRRIMLP